MADVFAAAGYRTAAFGKMHLQPMLAAPEHRFEESLPYWRTGAMEDWTGPFYGFEHVELCLGHHENQLLAEGHYARWIRARDPELTDHVLANQPDERYQLWEGPVPADLHVTSWLAQRVRSYIVDAGSRRQGGEGPKQPFCAFVGFPTPHHPFAPSPEYLARFESAHVGVPRDPEGSFLRASTAHRLHTDWPPVADLREEPDFVRQARRYTAAMISQIDDAVGQILASLEESGQADNTIVVLTSDHGDFLGEHGLLFKHELASDSLLHVPFLIRGPGVPPGTTDDELMSNVDVLPTLSGLTGIDCGDSIDGIDRSAVGSGADHAAISCNYGPVIGHNSRLRMNHTIYRENYRYTVYPKLRLEELFDLEQDPGETTNLLDRPRQSASPGSDTGETPRATADRLRAELAERLMDISVPVGRRYALF
jgi:arylsulfatase A-like enzyme